MNGLKIRDHFTHAGYDAEELYFHRLNQEKIEKLRSERKGKLRLVHSRDAASEKSEERSSSEENQPERRKAA